MTNLVCSINKKWFKTIHPNIIFRNFKKILTFETLTITEFRLKYKNFLTKSFEPLKLNLSLNGNKSERFILATLILK